MSKKHHLRRYSEVRPTEADADDKGYVVCVHQLKVDLVHWSTMNRGYYWCRTDEWQDHLQSLINGDTNNSEESGWVYAPLPGESDEEAAKHGRRWQEKQEGGKLNVLWKYDECQEAFIGSYSLYKGIDRSVTNLRRHCIPPDPPKKPRELPALSAVYDDGELARYATLRDGTHVHIMDRNNLVTYLIVRNQYHSIIVVNNDGYFQADKAPNEHDIVHVGGWLTAEELEAKRNEA